METPEGIRQFCGGKIAHFKIPQHIRIVDSFPMTITGKAEIPNPGIGDRGVEFGRSGGRNGVPSHQ
jgi:hypothetical protein